MPKTEEIEEDMISYIKANIGRVIDFEDNKYLLYSFNDIFNHVELTLANGGYPIFRNESIETIYYVLKNQETELNEEIFESQYYDNQITEDFPLMIRKVITTFMKKNTTYMMVE